MKTTGEMKTVRQGLAIPLLTVAAGLLFAGAGRADMFKSGGFKIYGDFRARLEADFDSQRASGGKRDDRTRIRIRARVGLEYAASDKFTFGLRLRSGSDDSQQSPHITVVDLDDNDTGDAHFNFDKWFLKAKYGKGWGWIGRNSLPFWKQNEFFWDDDVTPAGIAFGIKKDHGEGGFAANGGYFSLPAGMRQFSGNLGLAQVVLWKNKFKIAGGLLDVDANPGDADGTLLMRGNGARDYQIWVLSLQAGAGKWTFGLDGMHNAESYPAAMALRNEVDGYVGSVKVKINPSWKAAYYYARIEALAVNSSYAQDDWVRWGSATQTRASDMEGHELRLIRDLGSGQNLVFRLYDAKAITTDEDGGRFRIDYNIKF